MVAAAARVHLGRLAFAGFREWGLLARLLDADERIEAMAHGKLTGGVPVARQRIAVATDRRLFFVEKGFVTGRERVDTVDWDDVASVDAHPPSRIVVALHDGGRFDLSFVQAPQLSGLLDAVRAHTRTDDAPVHGARELQGIVRRKLGRLSALALEGHVLALAGELAPGETVLEVAHAAAKPDGLLAATSARVIFVPSGGLRPGAAESLAYDEIGEPRHDEDGTVALGDRRWHGVLPAERAASLVQLAGLRRPS